MPVYTQDLNVAKGGYRTPARYDTDAARWLADSAMWVKNAAGIYVPVSDTDPMPSKVTGSLPSDNKTIGAGDVNAINSLYNGTNFDMRRCVKLNKLYNGSLASGVEATVWTPGSGKKFRILFISFTADAAGFYSLKDNTAGTTVIGFRIAANAQVVYSFPPNGLLSASANNVLSIVNGTAGAASITINVLGTEE